jgi:transcriptional regulator with XRE-family HTH domain
MRTATVVPTGDELRRIRPARGLSSTEVGDASGVARTTVWRAERDQASRRTRRLIGLSLGLPLKERSRDERT